MKLPPLQLSPRPSKEVLEKLKFYKIKKKKTLLVITERQRRLLNYLTLKSYLKILTISSKLRKTSWNFQTKRSKNLASQSSTNWTNLSLKSTWWPKAYLISKSSYLWVISIPISSWLLQVNMLLISTKPSEALNQTLSLTSFM